jgi:hypothetical protein
MPRANHTMSVCLIPMEFAYESRQTSGMSTNAERFGQIVKARRDELDLNQVEVSQLGGPSNSKLTEIENGRLKQLTRQTARKLDRGLHWVPGSARTAWDGGDPTPARLDADSRVRADVEHLRQAVSEARIDEPTKQELLRILDSETA